MHCPTAMVSMSSEGDNALAVSGEKRCSGGRFVIDDRSMITYDGLRSPFELRFSCSRTCIKANCLAFLVERQVTSLAPARHARAGKPAQKTALTQPKPETPLKHIY